MSDLPADLEHLLHAWMPQQRWYPAKGRGVGIRLLSTRTPPATQDGAAVEVLVLGLDSGDRVDVVQVPLTTRQQPLAGAEHALVGRREAGGYLYDGPHDPAYVRALVGSLETAPGTAPVPADAPAHVLRGEQSNTSVVVEPDGGPPSIVKVFRTLHPGANPDVEVTAALSAAGCRSVPQVRGWLAGGWRGPDGQDVTGHLAVAVEFLAGSQDAWREALVSVEAGWDFSRAARELGAATADVHARLAQAMGTRPVLPEQRAALVRGLQQRVAWAQRATGDLEPYADALGAHSAGLERLAELPPLQRVHGDLHLGQVLHAPGRGWVLLDFEGEPLRPLHERVAPDLALRDVAGMLRSFDYAARHATLGLHAEAEQRAVAAADAWAGAARGAFCEGYASVAGHDPRERADLLAALELDKALYELVYETRNRPAWIPVPMHAVARLLG